MATSAKGSGFVGYNAQAAVETETHLIVAHDVINAGHDRDQLAPGKTRDRGQCAEREADQCREQYRGQADAQRKADDFDQIGVGADNQRCRQCEGCGEILHA